VALLRALPDLDVPGTELKRPRHGLLLVLQGRAGQVEVHLVRAGLLLLGRPERTLNPVSSLGISVRPSSAISRASTPAQNRARRLASFASKQRATR
jgi:hypothetical protein